MPRRSKIKREKAIARAMGNKKRGAASPKKRNHSHHGDRSGRKRSSGFSPSAVLTGTFSYSGRGFGFCVPDEGFGLPDVFIPPRKTLGAMTGDTVRFVLSPGTSKEKPEGEVLSVEPSCTSLIGTLHIRNSYACLVPDSKRYGVMVYVPVGDCDTAGAKDGDKVEVVPHDEPAFTRTRSITIRSREEMPYFDTEGRIATVFGSSLSRDANYSAILYSSGIPTEFPEAVFRHADSVAAEVLIPDGRRDLRNSLILTIDGAGAKDLDDAISLTATDDGYVLGVHIADVSHYVRPGTPTEQEARNRGTSVYFTDKVVPMLPEVLSNGACSLNAGEDKYALSAEITLDKTGRRLGTRIYKSILRSTVRGVYSEVNDLFEQGDASPYREKYASVLPMLQEMRTLYERLADNAKVRGVMELEDSEAVIVLNDEGHPIDVVRRERGIGEKLIEQFMLQANMGVAETLHSLALPCLYRIHEKPDGEKLRDFALFVHNLDLDARGLTQADPASETADSLIQRLSAILRDADERGIGGIVSSVLLRSMMKAKYQSVCLPHFGLGADRYCHFTSPIRRYPDLFVHSVITAVLEKTGLPELTAASPVDVSAAASFAEVAESAGIRSTDCEIRAMNAEREIEDLYMTLYMSDKIGESFSVTVTSVIRSGMFVRCENLVEGFLPAACYPGAKINEERMTMVVGEQVFTLGTPLTVRLAEADVSTGRITFEPENR